MPTNPAHRPPSSPSPESRVPFSTPPTSSTSHGGRHNTRGPGTRAAGFTLLEILVVVAIVATLTGLAVITLRGGGLHDHLARDADRLAALIDAGCEQALLESRTLGLRITPTGYDFWWPGSDETWRVADSQMLRARTFTAAWEVSLELDGRPVKLDETGEVHPQILCAPTGEFTPFELRLAHEGTGHTLSADFTGPLEHAIRSPENP